MHFEHAEHDSRPVYEKIIRAHTIISGYLFKGVNGGKDTELLMVSHTDPKGMIPAAIVNFNTERVPKKWAKSFQEKSLKLKREGKLG